MFIVTQSIHNHTFITAPSVGRYPVVKLLHLSRLWASSLTKSCLFMSTFLYGPVGRDIPVCVAYTSNRTLINQEFVNCHSSPAHHPPLPLLNIWKNWFVFIPADEAGILSAFIVPKLRGIFYLQRKYSPPNLHKNTRCELTYIFTCNQTLL